MNDKEIKWEALDSVLKRTGIKNGWTFNYIQFVAVVDAAIALTRKDDAETCKTVAHEFVNEHRHAAPALASICMSRIQESGGGLRCPICDTAKKWYL